MPPPVDPAATAAPASFEAAFDRAVAPWRDGEGPVCILFSGGVDSGLLAWELRHRPATRLFTVGRPGSADLGAAALSSAEIGLPWTGREVRPADLEAIRSRVSGELDGLAPTAFSVFVALALAIEFAPEGELLCGQGADELFLGYAHFAPLNAADAAVRAREDLARLLGVDWPRTQRVADLLGRTIRAPFLDDGFVAAASAVPIADRMPAGSPKKLWRAFARHRGVPAVVAERPKRALQYGTGIDRWLRRGR